MSFTKTYDHEENTVRGEANLIASSELSNVQFNALIRVSFIELNVRKEKKAKIQIGII